MSKAGKVSRVLSH